MLIFTLLPIHDESRMLIARSSYRLEERQKITVLLLPMCKFGCETTPVEHGSVSGLALPRTRNFGTIAFWEFASTRDFMQLDWSKDSYFKIAWQCKYLPLSA